MSLLVTKLPIDLKPILSALPKRAYVHRVTWDFQKSTIEVQWEHDSFHSGLSVPVEFPLEDLRAKFLPNGVKDKANVQPKPEPKIESATIEVPRPQPPAPDHIRTKKDFNKAIKAGKTLEFWGVQNHWFPVYPDAHTFTEGYIYRVVEPKSVDNPEPAGVTAETT